MRDTEYYKKYEPFEGTWRIKRVLGQGSFGKVFEIEREGHRHTYKAALKAITIPSDESELKNIRSELVDDASVTAHFHELVEEMEDELAIMSELEGHSNIVSYQNHEIISHEDGIGWDILIRMELLTPLLDYTAEKGMSERDVTQLGIDICRALEFCQKKNIIHRDIKPENIFISENGDFKLGDFGIARTAEKTQANYTGGVGTTAYMAPEVYAKKPYDATVDIYSLGVVLYRLLNNNRLPFLPPAPAKITTADRDAAREKRMGGELIPRPANGSEQLYAIVQKACSFVAEDRYQSPMQMREELEGILGEQSAALMLKPFSSPDAAASAQKSTQTLERGQESPKTENLFTPEPEGKIETEQPAVVPEAEETGTRGAHSPIRIRFLDGEREISSKIYFSGQKVVPPPTPKRPKKNGFRYVFTGWSPKVEEEAAIDTDYIAVFEREEILSSSFSTWLKAHRIPVAVAGAVLVLAVVLIVVLIPGTTSSLSSVPASTPVETDASQSVEIPIPESTATSAPELEFSGWIAANELAPSITSRDYVVETMTEYRSRPVYVYHKASDIPEEMIVITDDLVEKGLLPGDVQIDADYNAEIVEDWHIGNAPAGVTWQDADIYRNGTYPVRVSVWVPEYMTVTVNGRTTSYESGGHTEYRYESRTSAQYRDLKYYCVLRDGSDWSEYVGNVELPVDGELLDVDSRILCRYARRLGTERAPGMENFPELIENYALRFVDVDETGTAADWQIKPIGAAAQIGAMSADAYLRFRPEENVTIGELIEAAVVIHRTYHGKEGALWGQSYVDYALDNGLIEEGSYTDLAQKATRFDAARILWRVLPDEELPSVNSVNNITDVDDQLKVYDSVSLLAQAGIISWPEPDGEFRPDDSITRAETAAFISRLAYPQMRVINE